MAVTLVYEGEDKFLREVTSTLHEHLRENLIALVVFGSYARGEATEASDCDLYVIAAKLPKHLPDRSWFVREPLAMRFHRTISVIAKTKKEFEAGFPSLYLDLALDGVLLFDTDDYMQNKLARIRELTREAGLHRIRFDGEMAWKWRKRPAPRWELDWEGFRELA